MAAPKGFAAKVKAHAASQGITEGYGARGRVNVTLIHSYLLDNPREAKSLAVERGLSSNKGKVSKAALTALATTLV